MHASMSSRVQMLFGSQPRDGTLEGTLWQPREKIEKRLSQLLSTRSQNVCIDGPTGSGKSSIALTVLSQIKQKYIWVPVYSDMSWPDFCEEVAIKSRTANVSVDTPVTKSLSLRINSRKPLAGGELINPARLLDRITLESEDEEERTAALRQAARTWKIADIEGLIEATEFYLLIDDFEKASPSLTQSIADLCKRLTTRAAPKCIIIGTGETFARLYKADEGLDGRLAELSVASFGNRREVWTYLNDGFERLGFDTPRSMLRNRSISRSVADGLEQAFYEAADGMPKYINELGLRVCESMLGEENAPNRKRVTPKIAESEAERMLQENLSRCNQQVRSAERELRASSDLRLVLRSIFELGANGVHTVANLLKFIEHTDPHFSYDQFVSGFEHLRRLGLYVQTGKSGEVVFAKEPMFSHVLGLICHDPERFGRDKEVFGILGQRSLPLLPA